MNRWRSLYKILTGLFFFSGMLVLCGFASINDIESAIIQKDYKNAKILAEDFLAQNPAGTPADQVRYYLGISLLGLGEYPKAQSVFEDVMHKSSSDALYEKAWVGMIDSLGLQRNFEEALRQEEQFLIKRPHSDFLSVIYLKLGRSNLKLSRRDKAREYLQILLRDFSQSPEAHIGRQLLKEKRYFSVQVGAFIERERAMALMNELKTKGEYSYIVQTEDREGRTFYRVRVGQLASLDEANQAQDRLSQAGYPTNIYP